MRTRGVPRIHLVKVGEGRLASGRKERTSCSAWWPMAHAICILPERSAAAPGLVTRPIEGLFGAGIGDRDGLGIDQETVSQNLVGLGYEPLTFKTERFGPSGG